MRVSNAEGQNWKQSRTADTRRTGGAGFSDLLKKQTSGCQQNAARSGRSTMSAGKSLYQQESTVSNRSGEYTAGQRKAGKPAEIGIKISVHINDLLNPVKFHLDSLTEERKAELNRKYNIQDIMPGSPEYVELLQELQRDGVISDVTDYMVQPGEWVAHTDENGNITSMLCYVGKSYEECKNMNLLEFFENMWKNPSAWYKELLSKEYLTETEQALLAVRKTSENIYNALTEIFSEQLA